MINSASKRILSSELGFSLVEILVAAVIFVGVFLMLFVLLGRVLSNSSGADEIRAASIADLHLAQFHDGNEYTDSSQFVEIDGIRYGVSSHTETSELRRTLRLAVFRASFGDTLGVFYGIRYVAKD